MEREGSGLDGRRGGGSQRAGVTGLSDSSLSPSLLENGLWTGFFFWSEMVHHQPSHQHLRHGQNTAETVAHTHHAGCVPDQSFCSQFFASRIPVMLCPASARRCSTPTIHLWNVEVTTLMGVKETFQNERK